MYSSPFLQRISFLVATSYVSFPGVTSDEYYIADRILRHLAPEGEFTLEAIRTDTGELEFDKVKESKSGAAWSI